MKPDQSRNVQAHRSAALSAFLLCALSFAISVPAYAALLDNGDGTITDADVGLMWAAAPNKTPLTGLNHSTAASYADGLVLGGHSDWRLPSAADLTTGVLCVGIFGACSNTEMGHLVTGELGGVAPIPAGQPFGPTTGGSGTRATDALPFAYYWLAEDDPTDPTQAHAYLVSWDGIDGISIFAKTNTANDAGNIPIYALAVRELSNDAPEPGTLGLLGIALAMLGWLGRAQKRIRLP